jgi:bifunctional non-homologous end joining protein LigD
MSSYPVAPMLAVPSAPFDSDQYSFEVKWDGIRALARVEAHGWWLWGREQADYTARYPELAVLRQLPAGTLVDGELVVFDAAGRPELRQLLCRHGLTDAWKIEHARRWCPVVYLVFDLLLDHGRCLQSEPLSRRREALAEQCNAHDVAGMHFSTGVIGTGIAFYAAVLAAGQEGVMAKQLSACYRPGQRSSAWRKIKPGRHVKPEQP